MYLRFVAGGEAENPFWLDGVFIVARIDLLEAGRLTRPEARFLDETFSWFNAHLPCPPFEVSLRSGRWSGHAVSWFRPDAGEPLRRMWDLVALLQDHGIWVRLFKTRAPGKIVYSDRYQVVAEAPRWA